MTVTTQISVSLIQCEMMTMAGFGLEENKASVSFDPQLNQLSFHIDVARKVQALERTLSEGWLTC